MAQNQNSVGPNPTYPIMKAKIVISAEVDVEDEKDWQNLTKETQFIIEETYMSLSCLDQKFKYEDIKVEIFPPKEQS